MPSRLAYSSITASCDQSSHPEGMGPAAVTVISSLVMGYPVSFTSTLPVPDDACVSALPVFSVFAALPAFPVSSACLPHAARLTAMLTARTMAAVFWNLFFIHLPPVFLFYISSMIMKLIYQPFTDPIITPCSKYFCRNG